MNLEEKEKIKMLREEGLGYKKISNELGISVNTIKSFCRNIIAKSVEIKSFKKSVPRKRSSAVKVVKENGGIKIG